MKHHILFILPLISLTVTPSCDKAREIADKAASGIREKIAAEPTGEAVDPALAELVDETPEGVMFRKDLPFPERLEVTVTRRHEWSGRMFLHDGIERRAETLKGTRSTTHKLVLADGTLRHETEQSAFTLPATGGEEKPVQTMADPLKPASGAGKPIVLTKTGNVWKPQAGGDFRSAALAMELSPVMNELLVENALAPRPLWFSDKKRFKPGDTLTVNSDWISIFIAGKAVGELKLTLDSLEPVAGHPCAVFMVTGSYSRRQFPDFDGQFSDEEVTIQSGKLWLSLIHPVVLREELETIQSLKTGPAGSPATHCQGAVKVSVKRQWKVPAA